MLLHSWFGEGVSSVLLQQTPNGTGPVEESNVLPTKTTTLPRPKQARLCGASDKRVRLEGWGLWLWAEGLGV